MRFGKRGGWQGAIDEARPNRPVFPYQRAFQCVARAFADLGEFLCIGVGTGTALNSVLATHGNATLRGVEIDEIVLDVAIQYFGAPNFRRADYWIGDGFAFVRENEMFSYDLVFVDAYMRNEIYQPALSVPTLLCLLEHLNPNGVIVYNLIGQSMSESHPSRGPFLKAAKNEFAQILDLPVGFPYTDQNRLLILTQDSSFQNRLQRTISHSTELSILERVSWPFRLNLLR